MFKVETHDNSLQYFKNLIIEEDAIHVTGNNALASLIIEVNEEKFFSKELSKKLILNIEKFEKKLYFDLENPIERIKLKSELRDEISKIKIEYINNYFLKNIDNVFDTIIFLIKCGIEKINKNLNYDNQSRVFINTYNNYLNNKNLKKIYKCIKKKSKLGYKKTINSNKIIRINKIYFYNISQLSIKRFMLFYNLKNMGFEITFRVPYFNGLKEINKYWEAVYNQEVFKWCYGKNDFRQYIKQSKYIAFIEGKDICETKENVSTKTYYEISNFVKDIENKNVVTFMKDSIKSCQLYKKEQCNHCYNTKIGRFIKNIYKCRLKLETINLDYNIFIELITSGWIQCIEKPYVFNGKSTLEFFKENEDYFRGINTIDEILERLYNLKDLKEINNIFETKKYSNDIPKLLINPFRALSYANSDKYKLTLNQVIKLTKKLKIILMKLLENESGFIDYEKHKNILKEIYFHNLYINKLSEDNNLSCVYTQIKKMLTFDFDKRLIHIEELKQLFNILLTIKKNNSNKTIVLDDLEGFIYKENIHKGCLHITDLSYKSYKKYIDSKKEDSFILPKRKLNNILINSIELDNNMKNYINKKFKLEYENKDTKENIDDFLKFTIGNMFINFKGKILFSWVRDLRENDDKSVILRHMENLYKNDISSDNIWNLLEKCDENFHIKDYSISCEENIKKYKKIYYNIPSVAYKDLDFCEEKFFYSNILERYPIYKSDFHHRVVLSVLISLLKNNINNYYMNIKRYILPLFPQWPDVIKENIILINYSTKNFQKYRKFKNIYYPKNVDKLYSLRSKYIIGEKYKINNRYNNNNLDEEKIFEEFLREYLLKDTINNPGKHCSMCPHTHICRKGVFRIGNR
ncbi:hypothetical protein CLOACE_05320 [Clostridium acetireducens DSM 10703]|uniref:Uncharacterized protein n=1 Tax=Clostridium acetireducens DSM 10703 TaxID=1121290 RepID=A0A1E8F124_9CLOT|nr:hypothetical protein [Clostridium acetireducens]OFI07127.1 hypothetical protein CLOACE_05320 [Clostridium acetireducens DSM 10703]